MSFFPCSKVVGGVCLNRVRRSTTSRRSAMGFVDRPLLAFAVVFLPSILAQNVPPFPVLPNQFITEVEANIVNKNRTVQVTEYYDLPNDRARLEVFSNGSRHISIFSYAQGLQYRITDVAARQCTARPFTPRPGAPSAFTNFAPDGSAHLQSVSQFFHFGREFYETYNGTDMARGILCDVYLSTVTNTTFNYSMKWYFAVRPTWTMPLGQGSPATAIPVRLDLEGVALDFNRTSRTRGGGTHTFRHIYEFVNFRLGAADESLHLFDPPHGIPCTGQPISKNIPTLPDQFSVNFEVALSANQTNYFSLVSQKGIYYYSQ